ncbi:hypothetical protein [Rhodococcus opacus]|uniref:hypothetical protein n=1 Tax=Rhodococcus opacus TaxID=37919 RepID=UPI00211E6C50|nr:hypothetical protein [Rhodococcus opacus]
MVLVGVPFRIAAALRGGARVFHPRGLVATGHIELHTRWWTLESGTTTNVVARLSGGVGTPTGVPDVLGLALKIPLDPLDSEWDLLLASSGTSAARPATSTPDGVRPARPAPTWCPHRSTNRASGCCTGRRPNSPRGAGAPVLPLRESIAVAPLRFRLELVSVTGSPVPAGQVTLTRVQELPDDAQPIFDPVLHCPPWLALRPAWLAGVRVGAYRGSRRGRGDRSP